MRSAAREGASEPVPERKQLSRERLQEGAIDTLLNSLSILGEVAEDFRSSDKFFKYKAFVLLAWLTLTVGAFGIACPQAGPTNDISAKLIVGDGSVYMIKNESGERWEDVEIVVNHAWRATVSGLDGNGAGFTLSPAVVFDAKGARAPSSLKITEIEIHVGNPEAVVVLLRGGTPLF